LGFAVELVGVGDFGDTAHGQLGRKAKGLAHRAVGQPMDGELPKRLSRKGDLADVVACGIGRFKRALEGIGVLRRWQELELNGQSHSMIVPQREHLCKYWAKTVRVSAPKGKSL